MKKLLLSVLTLVMIATLLTGCADNTQETNTLTESSELKETSINEFETQSSELASDKLTEDHEHSYTSEITKEATCDESGVMTYACSCGDTYTESIDRMDHCTDRNEVIKEATCEEEGIRAFYCIFCGREIYTETIAKLPHTESCNHETAETEIPMNPKDYTFTECIKILYVTGTTGLYSVPHESSEPYRFLEVGTAVPVISKCDQSNFYRTPWGMTISGENLSEQRPAEYSPGGEEGWENFVEEVGERYTYWSGIYRANGFEVHCDRLNKPYVERHMLYAQNGLYTLIYREVNSDLSSGHYEIVIEESDFFAGQYCEWIEAYMKSQGIKTSVSGQEWLQLYRSPKNENSEQLIVVMVSVGK